MRSRLRTTLFTAGVGFYCMRIRRERGRIERLAAAALESLLNAVDANDSKTGGHLRSTEKSRSFCR